MRLLVWFFIGALVATLAIVALPLLLVALVGVWLAKALA
jgi:hypothetical protein